ncbi:hypothetical protein [Bradyrhizobium manausense]|uniref:Uncharacterized protein n=1 Tax=Bradyrhizobium manausense TaxID=989370 RepID=A0A0R3CTC0_9BRAD|nr:hypothetical protein [Bradyrhizobium manausense]KRQ00969.1 hypothetical protein AOQ71_38910 [Bradyrhizobium manausense]
MMYFTLIRSKAASASMQANLSLLEALVRTARSRFSTLVARLSELHNRSVAIALWASLGKSGKHNGHGDSLASVARDAIAVIKVMDRMADELLLESKQSLSSVGHLSGNVREIAFGGWRLLGGQSMNDLRAVAVEEKLRRMPRLVISLLEVATILEGTVADLAPTVDGKTIEEKDHVSSDSRLLRSSF